MFGGREIELNRSQDRLEEALRLTADQTVNGLDGRHNRNRQVCLCGRSYRVSGQFIGRPICDGYRTDSDG
jgi:hypothetical protein